MAELAHMIRELLPEQEIKIELVPYPDSYPAGEPMRRCPDLKKIISELNYAPNVDLKSGLLKTLDWYREELKKV